MNENERSRMDLYRNVGEISGVKGMEALSEYGEHETSEDTTSSFVPVRALLDTALRPRVVGRGGKRNWGETFYRFSLAYDLFLSHSDLDVGFGPRGGSFSAILDPHQPLLDLVVEFYRLFPEAREEVGEGDIPKSAPRPNVLIVQDDRLRKFVQESLKEVFGNLVEGTRFDFDLNKELPFLFPETTERSGGVGKRRSRSPEFIRLQEAISLAARSLGESLPDVEYERVLREVMEAYLSYSSSLRNLPKPEV